jgi:hypothetical protein
LFYPGLFNEKRPAKAGRLFYSLLEEEVGQVIQDFKDIIFLHFHSFESEFIICL